MRHTIPGAFGVLALALALVVPSRPAAAYGMYEATFSATVTQVLVNRAGAITVSGTIDCTAAVLDAYRQVRGEDAAIPENTTVFININWDAAQNVGRTKVVSAQYRSGIAHVCFNNNPDIPTNAEGTQHLSTTAPWSWATLYPYPQGSTQWVYATNGKFASGPIRIDLAVTADPEGYTFEVDGVTFSLYHWSSWNLRAMRVR